jgi:PAS domain S-box-containing protein
VLRKVREEAPVSPRCSWPEVPPALEAVCLRALAKRPEDRPAAAGELAQEVQGWQEYERRKAEEALRQSEALYHSLVESLPCYVFRKDLEGRFTFANQRFCELEDRPIEELLGKTDFDIYPRDLAEKYRRDDRTVIETGVIYEDIEEHLSVEARGKRYLHTLKTAVRDSTGKVIGMQGIAWDVTARKLAEEELRRSRERFELAVRASQDGLWDWDVETNQVWYSPQIRAMLGYDEHELPNRPGETEKRVHPDDHARWRATLDEHVAGTPDHRETEYRIRHKDGTYRWVRDRSVALRRPDGKAYRIAGSREDITKRKQFQEQLAYERYLLDTLMDNLPDAIVFADTGNRFVRVNKAFTDLFGLDDPAQLVGKTYSDLLRDDDARRFRDEHQEMLRTGNPVVAKEDQFLLPDGRVWWVSRTKMPFHDRDGNILGTIALGRDITQRKQEEITLRQSEERYRSAIAAMQDGVVLLDADGTIRDCNASAERILGLSADQLMGRASLDPRWGAIREDGSPFPDEDRPAVVTLRTGQPCANVIMGVHKPDGTLTWLSVNSQPLFHADGTTLAGVVACFADITDRYTCTR